MNVEDAIDEIYAADLDRFVEVRSASARALRDDGRRDEAATVAALRKPTVAAWALNRLVRTHRADVDRLLEAGQQLVEGQLKALSGAGRSDLDAARSAENESLAALVDAARELLGERVSETTLRRIEETLRAAAVSPEGRELLARGRFVKEGADTGWGVLETIAGDTAGRRSTTRPRGERTGEAQARRARELLRDARERRVEAGKAVRDAERRRSRAARELASADRELADAERELADAAAAVTDAERAVRARKP